MKKILLAAVAALFAFTSCNKDVSDDVFSNETKSVYVKISGGAETRAVSEAIGTKPVAFNGGFIIFTNGTAITKTFTIGTGATDIAVADLKAGTTLAGIPDYSTNVYVFGNVPSSITINTAGSISDIQEMVVTAQAQADKTTGVDNIGLYGTGGITLSGSVHSATFAVKPIGARVELTDLTASGSITGFQIDGIYINNYYPNSTLDGKIEDAIVNNGDVVARYVGGSTAYPSALTPALYDYAASGGIGVLNNKVYSPTATASDIWAYNVLAPSDVPAAATDNAPHVIVRLSNITTNNGIVFTTDQFLTIRLKSGAAILAKLEAGKAYNFASGAIVFNETNLTEKPEIKTMEVECEITLADWTTVPVTPAL